MFAGGCTCMFLLVDENLISTQSMSKCNIKRKCWACAGECNYFALICTVHLAYLYTLSISVFQIRNQKSLPNTPMFPSPSDLDILVDVIFKWASLGLPGRLMNSHDRNKGAERGFVVRCKASWEGPVRQEEQVEEKWGRTSPVSSIMSCSTEGSAGHGEFDSYSHTWPQQIVSPMRAGSQRHHRNPPSYLSGALRCCVVW